MICAITWGLSWALTFPHKLGCTDTQLINWSLITKIPYHIWWQIINHPIYVGSSNPSKLIRLSTIKLAENYTMKYWPKIKAVHSQSWRWPQWSSEQQKFGLTKKHKSTLPHHEQHKYSCVTNTHQSVPNVHGTLEK